MRFASEDQIKRVRELIEIDDRTPGLPETGERITNRGLMRSDNLRRIAGVMVSDQIYYAATGANMGLRPEGDDVQDRAPGIPNSVFGHCYRCQRSWKWVEGHITNYCPSSGCFPLCEKCWSELTPTERLCFYEVLWQDWKRQGSTEGREFQWGQIKQAVLEGK